MRDEITPDLPDEVVLFGGKETNLTSPERQHWIIWTGMFILQTRTLRHFS